MKQLPLFIALLLLLTGCSKQKADLIIYNGKIYTVNDKFDMAEAMAVQDGKIIDHTDTFDFYRWARMAFGVKGILLGWTPFFKSKVQLTVKKALAKFTSRG